MPSFEIVAALCFMVALPLLFVVNIYSFIMHAKAHQILSAGIDFVFAVGISLIIFKIIYKALS